MSPCVNFSDQTEITNLGSLGANVPECDSDSCPTRDKAKEIFVQKAARRTLERREKE